NMKRFRTCAAMLSLVAVAAQATPPPKKNGRSSQRPAAAVSAEDLQALKDALAAQQQQIEAQQRQIDQLRQELGQKDANWRDAQQRATEAQGRLSAIESQNKQQLQEQVRCGRGSHQRGETKSAAGRPCGRQDYAHQHSRHYAGGAEARERPGSASWPLPVERRRPCSL